MNKLTDWQREVYDFIEGFIKDDGYAPSIREIGEHFGFNLNVAQVYLKVLERKGKIKRPKGKSGHALARAIILTPPEDARV